MKRNVKYNPMSSPANISDPETHKSGEKQE